MCFLLDIFKTHVHIVLEQSRYKGCLGLKLTYLLAWKAANVVKATVFQVHGVWPDEKRVSHSLPFLSSKHFSALAYSGILCLTTWKAFWGEHDWSIIWWNSLTTRPLEAGQEYVYIYSIYFPPLRGRRNRIAFPEAEKCSSDLSSCSHLELCSPSLPEDAPGHSLSCTRRQQPGASVLCWEASIHLLCPLELS